MSSREKLGNIRRTVSAVAGRIEKDRVGVYSAQASFFMTISFVPCLMLSVSVLGYLLPSMNIDFEELFSFLPHSFYSIVDTMLKEIKGGANAGVLSLTTLALIWAASYGVRSLSEGIREVYGGHGVKRSFLHSLVLSILYTVIFIIIIAAVIVLLVFGNLISSYIPSDMAAANTILGLRGILFLVLLTVLFMLAYSGFSKTGMKFSLHFLGAAFSAVGWLIYSWLFSLYIEHFAHYSVVYGGIAAIVVFMIWLFMCMKILLLGAEINACLCGSKEL